MGSGGEEEKFTSRPKAERGRNFFLVSFLFWEIEELQFR